MFFARLTFFEAIEKMEYCYLQLEAIEHTFSFFLSHSDYTIVCWGRPSRI